jgi:hypothetical protein
MVRHSLGTAKRSETLDYLQSMLGELRAIAASERYDMLAYLIDMAFIEAGDLAGPRSPASGRKDQRDSAA